MGVTGPRPRHVGSRGTVRRRRLGAPLSGGRRRLCGDARPSADESLISEFLGGGRPPLNRVVVEDSRLGDDAQTVTRGFAPQRGAVGRAAQGFGAPLFGACRRRGGDARGPCGGRRLAGHRYVWPEDDSHRCGGGRAAQGSGVPLSGGRRRPGDSTPAPPDQGGGCPLAVGAPGGNVHRGRG